MNARMKLFVERTLPMMDPLGEMAEAGAVPTVSTRCLG